MSLPPVPVETLESRPFTPDEFRASLGQFATGVTIVSTSGGAVFNWANETVGFNRNDTSYPYTVT